MTLTYHNDNSIKAALSSAMAKHRRLDNLHQGATGDEGRGCSIACAGEALCGDWEAAYDHTMVGERIGMPEWAMQLVDHIFETVPSSEAGAFSQAWIDALPVGADTTLLASKVMRMIIQEASANLRAIDQASFCPLAQEGLSAVMAIYKAIEAYCDSRELETQADFFAKWGMIKKLVQEHNCIFRDLSSSWRNMPSGGAVVLDAAEVTRQIVDQPVPHMWASRATISTMSIQLPYRGLFDLGPGYPLFAAKFVEILRALPVVAPVDQ